MTQVFQRTFGIDSRALSALRIGLGSIVVIDLLDRLQDLSAHYTDYGVVPRELLNGMYSKGWPLSLHLLSDKPLFQLTLFVISIAVAISFTIGFKTKASSILLWALITSLHARNPFIEQGGDMLLRLLLFWGMFLPLGAHWSLDAKNKMKPSIIVSIASAAMTLQMCMLYLFNGLWKFGPEWSSEFTAVAYSLRYEPITTSLASWISSSTVLTIIATAAIPWFEIAVAILILVPLKKVRLRQWIIPLCILLHILFALCFHLDIFIWVSIVGWVTLLPSSVYDRIEKTSTKKRDVHLDVTSAKQCVVLCFLLLSIAYVSAYYFTHSRAYAKDPGMTFYSGKTFLPESLENTVHILKLTQHWRMFAPEPPKINRWYTLHDENGTELLWQNNDEPPFPFTDHVRSRWRNLLTQYHEQMEFLFPSFGTYMCNIHAAKSVALIYHTQPISLEGKSLPKTQTTLGTHQCSR